MRDTDNNRINIYQIKGQAQSAAASEASTRALIAQLHDSNPVVARNAAWALTHFTDEQLLAILPMQSEFIDLAISTDNSSLRRLVLNVIERQGIEFENMRTDFLDFCIDHMTAPTEAPGIQSLCMKLAYRMCSYYPDLLLEFRYTLLMMEEGYATSVSTLRNKFLKLI